MNIKLFYYLLQRKIKLALALKTFPRIDYKYIANNLKVNSKYDKAFRRSPIFFIQMYRLKLFLILFSLVIVHDRSNSFPIV